ncbi:MAG: hypothetical protein R3D53_09455 [Paracoccaceae bacterium]
MEVEEHLLGLKAEPRRNALKLGHALGIGLHVKGMLGAQVIPGGGVDQAFGTGLRNATQGRGAHLFDPPDLCLRAPALGRASAQMKRKRPAHAGTPSRSDRFSARRRQAALCPGPTVSVFGAVRAQASVASGQRVWNLHPEGGFQRRWQIAGQARACGVRHGRPRAPPTSGFAYRMARIGQHLFHRAHLDDLAQTSPRPCRRDSRSPRCRG